MNIAFDATAILGPMSKNRGIGNYSLSQFTKMIEMGKDNNYFLINFFENTKLFDIGTSDNIYEFYFDCGKDGFLLNHIEYKEVIGDVIKKFIKENQIDVFYITSPFDDHVQIYEKEWFEGVNTVVTVYDVIPYVFKERYLSDKSTYQWYMKCIEMLRWIDKLLVISESVKQDLIKHLSFNEKKIDVIWGAVDDIYKEISITAEEKVRLFRKFKIQNQYIMCTGGDDERKNLQGLIEAYSQMPEELISKYQLVIVCKLSDHSVERYSNLAKERNIENRIVLTNFVSQEELLMLYNLATVMAFPSKYEGFGLPIVEAWACGTPVLTSNNSSLVEIAGDGAVIVDPFKIENITRGLIEILSNIDLDVLLSKGKERLNYFQWKIVAKNAIKYIQELEINETGKMIETKKIAFFTPLPPIQSGISDYSVDILNSLSEYFDIDVFIDDAYKVECDLNNNINVYNHKRFNVKENYYDIIYQVGNSEYHIYMFAYIKKYKGTVVLHDYNLHGVVQHKALYIEKRNFKLYSDFLLEDLDEGVVQSYLSQLSNGEVGLKINEMELNGFITNYANKIIVHSDEAKEKLLRKDISRNVRTIRSYAKIEDLVDNVRIKENNGIDKKNIVISSFGHIHETKRAIPTIKAFSKLCKNYSNIKYLFVGKLDSVLSDTFNNTVRELHLEDRITVTGYTELQKFEEYINMTDICLNLRYPYNGETSGSLMRILAKGKSVIVNNIGSFSEIPDNACIKIPNVAEMTEEQEIDEIYHAMDLLVSKEEARIEMGINARKYAEQNLDLNVIAKQYADFINTEYKSSLNEDMLRSISEKEIKPKRYSENEIVSLTRTLAYGKSYV